jgi:hypothetical protein
MIWFTETLAKRNRFDGATPVLMLNVPTQSSQWKWFHTINMLLVSSEIDDVGLKSVSLGEPIKPWIEGCYAYCTMFFIL